MSRSRRVLGRIQKALPGTVLCKDMLVIMPTERILRGFLLETTTERNKVYLWRVVTPLYRPMSSVFLDYSNRIPDGEKVHIDPNAFQQSLDEVCSIISTHLKSMQELRYPQDFLRHIGWMIGNTSINFRFDLALTYHRVGDAGRSRKLLRELGPDVNQLEEWRRMPIDRSIEEAARVMESDPMGFAALLDDWENKNVETLGLQQSRICRPHNHPHATGPSTLL